MIKDFIFPGDSARRGAKLRAQNGRLAHVAAEVAEGSEDSQHKRIRRDSQDARDRERGKTGWVLAPTRPGR